MNNSFPTKLKKQFAVIPGYIFVFGSIFAFVTAFFVNFRTEPYIHITIGILAFIFGYVLLRGGPMAGTLPEQDVSLFGESLSKCEDPLKEYLALRELVGIPGFFRNLGITGLPLATITITILFCLLAIFSYVINAVTPPPHDIIPSDFPKLVLELSKLTLGAFIGSFVAAKSK